MTAKRAAAQVATSSLRERRRRQTAREIHDAAIDLTIERGFGELTVELIAERSGISPRTFFNYFSSKEQAVLYGPDELSADDVDVFVNGESGVPRDVLKDLVMLLATGVGAFGPRAAELRTINQLAQEHPSIRAELLLVFEEREQHLVGLAAQRLGRRGADEKYAELLAALAFTAVRVALHRWDLAAESGPEAVITESVEMLSTILAGD